MDKDKFMDWVDQNYEELTHGYAMEDEGVFNDWCLREYNTLLSLKEDLR